MKLHFRFLSAFACIIILISCIAPLCASATIAVPDWAVPLQSYTDSYEESIQEIQNQNGYLAHVLNDPNISNEEKRQILIGNALQTFDFKFAADLIAHYNDDGFPTEPEEVTVSGGGYAGYYYFDSKLYTGVLYPRPENWSITYGASGYQPVCSTPHFTVDITMEPVSGVTYYYGGNARIYTNGGNGVFKFNASAVFQPYTINYMVVDAFWRPSDTIPSYYSNSALLDLSRYFNGYQFFLGSAVSVSLPSGTVNTARPWEYYNNTLLPYLRENVYNSLSSNVDVTQLLVFPNGYHVQEPTEPPTFPKGDIWVGDYYDIDINFVTVTDANGEPVTDSEGETVTETQIVTETRPTDAVYKFQIPTLPQLETVDNSLPLEQSVPEHYASLLAGMFNLIDGFLTDSGIKPVLPFIFTIGIITFVIYRLS